MRAYKLTSEEAKLIGGFIGDDGIEFNPFNCPMTDNTTLCLEEDYLRYKDMEEIKRVDFSQKKIYEIKELEFKTIFKI